MRRTVLALVLVTALAACGPASDRETAGNGARVVSFSRDQITTKIVGATPQQRDVLTDILAGLGPTPLTSVEILRDLDDDWGAAPNAVGVSSDADEPGIYSDWYTELVGQAFAQRSEQLGLPQVAVIAHSRGASSVGGSSRELAEPTVTLAEAQAAAARVRFLAKRYGASVRRLDVLRPRRLAFALELQADHTAAFLLNGLDSTLKPLDDGYQRGYDGLYVKVLDGEGTAVLEQGAGYWVRNELDSCAPGLRSAAWAEPEPPPCPAEDSNMHISFGRVPASQVAAKINGATPRERELIVQALAGLGPTGIEEIEIGEAEARLSADPRAVALRVSGKNDLRTDWHAWLLAGSLSRRFQAVGLPPIAYVAVGDDVIAVDSPSSPVEAPEQELSLDETWKHAEGIARAATKSRAEVDSISILEPGVLAFDVRIRVESPALFLRDHLPLLEDAVALPSGAEGGWHIEIADLRDKFVWHGAAVVDSAGETSAENARASLEGCTPAPVHRPMGFSEPPYPAD